jgi:hypothetical protein
LLSLEGSTGLDGRAAEPLTGALVIEPTALLKARVCLTELRDELITA